MSRLAAGVVSSAAIVALATSAATSYACYEPSVTPTGAHPGPDASFNGSAYAGDRVEFDINNTGEGATYKVKVDGAVVKEGTDTTRQLGLENQSFEMPDLGGKSRRAEISVEVEHPDRHNPPGPPKFIWYLAAGAPIPGEPRETGREPTPDPSPAPTPIVIEQPSLEPPATEQGPSVTSSTPQGGSGPSLPGDGGGDPGGPSAPRDPAGSETVKPALEPQHAVAVASAAIDPLRTAVRSETAPIAKPDEGARVEQAPRTIPAAPQLPARAVPDSEPLPIPLLLAIALATGLGVGGAMFLRGRAAGQQPAPVRVPVAPSAPPDVVALEPGAVEAELQELIAEEKARELAAPVGEEHARDGPFAGSPS